MDLEMMNDFKGLHGNQWYQPQGELRLHDRGIPPSRTHGNTHRTYQKGSRVCAFCHTYHCRSLFTQTGVFNDDIREWIRQPSDLNEWDAFKAFSHCPYLEQWRAVTAEGKEGYTVAVKMYMECHPLTLLKRTARPLCPCMTFWKTYRTNDMIWTAWKKQIPSSPHTTWKWRSNVPKSSPLWGKFRNKWRRWAQNWRGNITAGADSEKSSTAVAAAPTRKQVTIMKRTTGTDWEETTKAVNGG